MTLRVGRVQAAALEIYVFDPVVNEPLFEDEIPFPGIFDGRVLSVTDPLSAWRLLVDAANSADDDHDSELRDALIALQRRLRVAALTPHFGP